MPLGHKCWPWYIDSAVLLAVAMDIVGILMVVWLVLRVGAAPHPWASSHYPDWYCVSNWFIEHCWR